MAQLETWVNCYLGDLVKVQYIDGNVFSMDNMGNLVGVHVFDKDGNPAELSGSVSAHAIRANGSTVAVTGQKSGNDAWVVLPQACYYSPGPLAIVIKLTYQNTITTLACVVANVYESVTGTIVDPGTIISSIETLISSINTAVASIPADYSALWTSLAPAFSTSSAYTAGQYVTNNGGVYRFLVNHAAGDWVSSEVSAVKLGNEIASLKSAIKADEEEYQYLGIKNIIRPYIDGMTGTTTQGVTFSYDFGKIKVKGTTNASNNATLVLYGDSSHFPAGIKADGTYFAQIIAQNQYIQYGIYYYTSGGTLTNIIRLLGNDGLVKFTVPSAAVGFRIAVIGLAGTHAIDESVYVAITDTEPLTDIRELVQKNTDAITYNEEKKNYILSNKYQLWDRFNVVFDELVQSDGTVVYNPKFVHCEIPVTAGKKYYFATPDPTTSTGVKTGNAAYICLINSDDTIYSATNINKSSLEIPNGVNRMIVTTYKERLYNGEFSVVSGDDPTNSSSNKWIPRYSNYTQECIGSKNKVSCIGDSLTEGSGGEGTSYPGALAANDASLEVMKFAFPSEDSLYIASATGGMRLYADPFTIPASNSGNSAPTITLKQDNGNNFVMDHIAEDNLCMIGGVLGKIKYESSVNKFQRLKPGSEIALTRPEPIYQCFELKHTGDITIIWVGTNDTQISSITEALFYHIDNIIGLLPHKKYLVVGVMDNNKFTNIGNVMTYFRRHYGSHFVNIRQYLLDYGIADAEAAGMTRTAEQEAQDATDISNGTIPTSLRSDGVHLNSYGYTVVGNYLYKLIQENGWLE